MTLLAEVLVSSNLQSTVTTQVMSHNIKQTSMFNVDRPVLDFSKEIGPVKLEKDTPFGSCNKISRKLVGAHFSGCVTRSAKIN